MLPQIRILRPTTILLIAFTCVTSYYAVTEAEGSSGSTWAKALPPAHVIPSESECKPYIEKAIKKLTDNPNDENAESEKNIDDIELKVSTSSPTVDGANSNQNSNEITATENENEVNSSENDIISESPTLQENVEQTDVNNSSEENNEDINAEMENEINQNKPEIDSVKNESSSDEEEDDTDTKEENETVAKEDDTIVSKEDEEDDQQIDIITEVTTTNVTDHNETVLEGDESVKTNDQDETETDQKASANEDGNGDDKNAATDSTNDEEEEQMDEEDGGSSTSKYKLNVKIKKYIPKKRKLTIAKIIKDKKLKKDLKEEQEEESDLDNGDGNGSKNNATEESDDAGVKTNDDDEDENGEKFDDAPEEELMTKDRETPAKLRNRKHITEILQLEDDENSQREKLTKLVDSTLKELKKLYENAIKPLEILYKYRDLSNRHFGDAEIFSKPLILFMGPYSGGKSSIVNYLLENEFKETALRTGAEPSPAYFNIVMWGENDTVLDGTQLAADWTFSGLQKFGQGLLDRLRGLQMPHALLKKVNIVEIPGILEIRKQVERIFPFNDACQWFIDRADIIFLVYDPAKLDVGPETEAILDQLKGREYQTRIILNKADQVKADELMRIQGTLIWNISPLMSSIEPPIMYTTSLWSLPYEIGAPTRLLHSQKLAFLKDLRSAIDRRVENKIASARRFAVRVRNHAKMVDCYLTTYYNHKSFFGNRKKVNDDIVEHPQNYHIYEGLSTLTNISRYDLPDPEVYRDFFRLHPIYEFQRLSDTCTYFRGCPINGLDIAIAYDLPELVGKYKRSLEHLSSNHEYSSRNHTNKTTK